MFTLTIADRGEPVLPDPRDPLVQVWHDYDGQVCAYAYSVGGYRWLHIPRVASYQIRHHKQITAYPQPHSVRERVRDVFSRLVVPIALHVTGIEVLHASAVLTESGVVAFCAMADTGKSTTAYALTKRGYKQWADDAVPFETKNGSTTAIPFPYQIRLDANAKKFFENSPRKLSPFSHTSFNNGEATPLAALCVLKRSHGRIVRAIRLSPAQAFRTVLLHGHFFNLKNPELMRQMVSNYMKLTSSVPVFEVRFQPGFEKLSFLLDRLELMFKKLPREIS